MKNYRLVDCCENCKYVHKFTLRPVMRCDYDLMRKDLGLFERFDWRHSRYVEPNGKCDNWEKK